MFGHIKRLLLAIMITGGGAAYAACDIGYYPQNGACAKCDSGYYCPDGDTMTPCPPFNPDATIAHMAAEGVNDFIRFSHMGIATFGTRSTTDDCVAIIEIKTVRGGIYGEHRWNGTDYWGTLLYTSATPGYYLSGHMWSNSAYNFYRTALPCTNAPANTHYTGPGTPDDPVAGGKTDYNDCPWVCDCGYMRSGNVCTPASECTAGVKTLRTGTGLIYKLYSVQTTSPTIAIGLNGNVCYACLYPGAADGALNLEWDDGIFHAVNGN